MVDGGLVNTGGRVAGTGRVTPDGGNGAFSERVTFGAVLASHPPLTDHISVPLNPSLAVKYKMLLLRAKRSGRLPPERLMSIEPVPTAVPSLTNNSRPLTPSLAAKYNNDPSTTNCSG